MTRKLTGFSQLPSYTDGVALLHEVNFTDETFQRKYIKDDGVTIYFREKAIYNKTKIEFRQIGVEVTSILMIPHMELKKSTLYAVVLDNEIFEVQNHTFVINSDGFKELELTTNQSNIVREVELGE